MCHAFLILMGRYGIRNILLLALSPLFTLPLFDA